MDANGCNLGADGCRLSANQMQDGCNWLQMDANRCKHKQVDANRNKFRLMQIGYKFDTNWMQIYGKGCEWAPLRCKSDATCKWMQLDANWMQMDANWM